jgi:ABC-type multidrug transport system fused ATPase/permease subunit
MKYRPDLPPVIPDLTVSIKSGEKIGVVGRTGAGKSSLFQALFRIVEPSGGKVEFDGQDTAQFGLEDVRRALAIIPQVGLHAPCCHHGIARDVHSVVLGPFPWFRCQDPVLFSGTIRFNLDPFSQYEDTQLWAALEKAQLYPVVSEHPAKLDMPVSEVRVDFVWFALCVDASSAGMMLLCCPVLFATER